MQGIKTMEDIQRLALHEPVVHAYLNLMKQGMTQEQALIGMVFTLIEQKNEVTKNYTEHLNNCTMPRIQPITY